MPSSEALRPPRTFLSHEFAHDADRAAIVRDAWSAHGGFVETESVDLREESLIKRWIDQAMDRVSVTVVLAGSHTGVSRWVDYEIRLAKALGKGLLGVDVSGIEDRFGRAGACAGRLPAGYPFYDWVVDDGARNLRAWVTCAAESASAGAHSEVDDRGAFVHRGDAVPKSMA